VSTTAKNHKPGLFQRISRFFSRQFAPEPTRAQRIFDAIGIFGVFFLMMLASFWEKENLLVASRIGDIAFQHLDLHVDLFSLVAWGGFLCLLLKRTMHPALLIPLASTQFLGAALCFLVGLQIWPYTVFFLFSPLVFFCILPWFPFFCFLRNGIRGIRTASRRYGLILPPVVVVLILSVLLGLTWPYLGDLPPWEETVEMWRHLDLP